jgi:hydrogenase/urease accessory protein HupE
MGGAVVRPLCNRDRLPLLATSVCSVLLWPALAEAHLVTTGLGPVYDGIGHLLLTPEDLIPVLALSLYAGLRGPTHSRRTLFVLPLAWFAGGVVGLRADGPGPLFLPGVTFVVLGVLVATDLRMKPGGVTALAVTLGVVYGFLNGAALKEGAGVSGLLGIMAVLFVVVALAAAFVVSLRRPWTRIAVRVAGSWVVATGMLMLGWLWRGRV